MPRLEGCRRSRVVLLFCFVCRMFGTGPKYSEIDIAESAGGSAARNTPPTGAGDDTAYGTLLHFSVKDKPTDEVTQLPGGSFHTPDGSAFADNYYVMWLEWTETEVWAGLGDDYRKIVDDISKLDAYQASMYLLLNVAVGGYYPQAPDAGTVFPQTMSVDWVRVWNKNGEDILRPVTASQTSASTGGADVTQPDASTGSSSPTTPTTPTTTPPPVGSTSTGPNGNNNKPPTTTTPDTTGDPLGTGANAAPGGVGVSLTLTAAAGLLAGWIARML